MVKTIKIEGMNKVLANIDKFEAKVLKDVDKEIEKGGLMIEADAKNLAPVKTGNLRRMIESKHALFESTVRSRANYSEYVNFGTRRQRAQPYFTNAINLNKRKILNNIKKAMTP